MKTILFTLFVISGFAFGQTNIIAAKSHSSNQIIDKNDTDNFGEPGPMRFIQTVKYLKDDCIVEKYKVEWDDHDTEYDTICDHPFLKENTVDIERIKAMYPIETKFIGFDKVGKNTKKAEQEIETPQQVEKKSKRQIRKEKRSKKSSGLIFFLIGTGLFLIYLFVPKMKLSNF